MAKLNICGFKAVASKPPDDIINIHLFWKVNSYITLV